MERLKTCSKCKAELPIHSFHKDKRANDGLRSRCKTCHCKAAADYHANNSARIRTSKALYRKINIDEISAKQKRFRQLHSIQIKAVAVAWRKGNAKYGKWQKIHPERTRLLEKNRRKNLTDGVIKRMLVRVMPFLITNKIPQELIEAKRWHLKVKRLLKETK